MIYADKDYYNNTYKGSVVPDAELDSYLQRASDDVDQLTYFRIGAKGGFGSLTPFQQDAVRKAVCSQADHLYTTQDIPDGVKSYSVNGVSMSFDGNMKYSDRALSLLSATGLRYRGC